GPRVEVRSQAQQRPPHPLGPERGAPRQPRAAIGRDAEDRHPRGPHARERRLPPPLNLLPVAGAVDRALQGLPLTTPRAYRMDSPARGSEESRQVVHAATFAYRRPAALSATQSFGFETVPNRVHETHPRRGRTASPSGRPAPAYGRARGRRASCSRETAA